jgi:hypothetical protein
MDTLHKEAGQRKHAYSLRELGFCNSPDGKCFTGSLAQAQQHFEAATALRDGHSFHGLAQLLTSRERRLTWEEVLREAADDRGDSLDSEEDGAQAVWLGQAPVPWHRVWRLLEHCSQSDYLADMPVALSTAETLMLLVRRATANSVRGAVSRSGNVSIGVLLADLSDLLFGQIPSLPKPPTESGSDGDDDDDLKDDPEGDLEGEAEVTVPLSPFRGALGVKRQEWRTGNQMPLGPLWLTEGEARVAAITLKAGFLTMLLLVIVSIGLLIKAAR